MIVKGDAEHPSRAVSREEKQKDMARATDERGCLPGHHGRPGPLSRCVLYRPAYVLSLSRKIFRRDERDAFGEEMIPKT